MRTSDGCGTGVKAILLKGSDDQVPDKRLAESECGAPVCRAGVERQLTEELTVFMRKRFLVLVAGSF